MTTQSGDVAFVETPESRKKRALDQKPLSREEQANLARVKQQLWAEQEKQEKEYYKTNNLQAKV